MIASIIHFISKLQDLIRYKEIDEFEILTIPYPGHADINIVWATKGILGHALTITTYTCVPVIFEHFHQESACPGFNTTLQSLY